MGKDTKGSIASPASITAASDVSKLGFWDTEEKEEGKKLLHLFSYQGGVGAALGVAFEEWLCWHPEEQQARILCQL